MLWWLTQTLVSAAVLAGGVLGLGGVARLRPAVLHALWVVVLLKLLTPPLLTWPWPLPDPTPPPPRPAVIADAVFSPEGDDRVFPPLDSVSTLM